MLSFAFTYQNSKASIIMIKVKAKKTFIILYFIVFLFKIDVYYKMCCLSNKSIYAYDRLNSKMCKCIVG